MEISKKLLVVMDDAIFGAALQDYLSAKGFEVTLTKNGMDGFEMFRKNKYDLCIIDMMMPYKDGYTLAREVHEKNKEVPIIFLLGKSIQEDVLKGYKADADDYINKPFDSEVLVTKIRTIIQYKLLESRRKINNVEFKIGEFVLNTNNRLLHFTGKEPVKLSPKENELLKMLALHENSLMVRELALVKIWRDNNYFTSRSMDVYIAKLRKHLKADQNVEILNVHGEGFCLTTENVLV